MRTGCQPWVGCPGEGACPLLPALPHACSPPTVVSLKYDRLSLQCTAPPLGPWATCALELCPAAGPSRRRALLVEGGCPSPIKTSCAFDANGAALCDLTGLVAQLQEYAVVATAVKADARTSKTGPQAPFTLQLYP